MERIIFIFILVSFIANSSCHTDLQKDKFCKTSSKPVDFADVGLGGSLLASRVKDLDHLKSLIDIKYYSRGYLSKGGSLDNDRVELSLCFFDEISTSVLSKGVNQSDILKARDGDIWAKLALLLESPYAVINHKNLKKIYILSRRRYDLFGRDDVAFYDLAESSVLKIRNKYQAYKVEKDSSELGFINSFNHITAQALITSCFSKDIASFIADVHERDAMPELINGAFTKEQIEHPIKNPIDNYVDMINNNYGQRLGLILKEKYEIDKETVWTEELLTNYLNDIQEHYSWSFDLSFIPFSENEDIIKRFVRKLNMI